MTRRRSSPVDPPRRRRSDGDARRRARPRHPGSLRRTHRAYAGGQDPGLLRLRGVRARALCSAHVDAAGLFRLRRRRHPHRHRRYGPRAEQRIQHRFTRHHDDVARTAAAEAAVRAGAASAGVCSSPASQPKSWQPAQAGFIARAMNRVSRL